MRWQARLPAKLGEGDIRTRYRFLFWPKRVENEWRWLEHARWEEQVSRNPTYPPGATFWGWRPTRWRER